MKRFALMIGLVLAGVFSAQSAPIVKTQAWVVGTHVSTEGETREQFLWRVASVMQAWTDEHGSEVCGYLATNGQQWAIKLTTQRSQVMCIFDDRIVPAGFSATKDYIHTHPTGDQRGFIKVSEDTFQAARAVRESLPFYVQVKEGFSDDDYRAGSGYLVHDGVLSYQSGRKKVEVLGSVRSVEALAIAQAP